MKLSRLQELPSTRQMIDVFGGYNHNLRIGEGEFYDMKNLTSSDYPVLSTRPQRGIYAHPDADTLSNLDVIKVSNPQGMIEKDALCYVDGRYFVINKYRIDMGLSTKEEDCPKKLISMGSYVIIFPDKMYINTIPNEDGETYEFGKIEASFKTHGYHVTFTLCRADGTSYSGATSSTTEPENPKDGDLWINTSEKNRSLMQYSEINSEWISIATTYVRIDFDQETGIPFNVGDGVTISGIETEALKDFNGTMVVKAVGDNGYGGEYIVVTGILDTSSTTITDIISVTRRMPAMDFVIESGNRLWGCRYGIDINGNYVNEIYASKLGDFKNWNVFDGISTDSYTATVGTDGQFTGAITHLGYPLFFKDNFMHKVYGNYPANFQVQTNNCRGVQKGCNKSLAIVNEVLYYKSRNAVCMYDGSLPAEISSSLGDETYSDAVAGAIRNKYYISMKDSNGKYHLFVFDTKRGLWHREDDTHAIDFCACRGELYYIEEQKRIVPGTAIPAIDRYIKTINPVPDFSYPFETGINWMAESGIIGTDMPDKKYISRLDVRMLLTVGTRVHFYIEYDSCGKWEHLFTMTGTKLQSFAVPIRPRRCDHMRIRIEGDGEAKIFSICKTIEQGSDI